MKNSGNFLNGKDVFVLLSVIALFSFYIHSSVNAETSDRVTAARTMRSDGDGRQPISVSVGSTTAVNPFSGRMWLWDQNRLRSISIQNPSSVDLYVGTWSGFTPNDQGWFISKNSGTWTTWNHATFYMLLGNNASTTTVRGLAEYDVQVTISSPNQKP